MSIGSDSCWSVFTDCIDAYHVNSDINQTLNNLYTRGTLEYLLYSKCWVDTLQWHLEDLIRVRFVQPREVLALKRQIDQKNKERLSFVDKIDRYFLEKFRDVKCEQDAKMNTESPARAIDRLSILALRVYHMREETTRKDASQKHREKCHEKLEVLMEQKMDLEMAIRQYLKNLGSGKTYFKIYELLEV